VAIADRLWEIKIGYDEAWSRVAPGILLTHKTLQHACEEGLEALEYLGAAEGWQERWPRSVRQHDTVRFYPYTLRGGLALTGDSIGYLARASTRERVRAE
jgi:CelD/BcsL family acetyltransferase involved in cellulose biosynthesis